MTLNNARIKSFGVYAAVHNIKPVKDVFVLYEAAPTEFILGPKETKNIWQGDVILEEHHRNKNTTVYFSMVQQPDKNEYDLIFPILHFKSKDILGEPFYLIPKDKLLFAYEKSSFIQKAPMNFNPKRRQ